MTIFSRASRLIRNLLPEHDEVEEGVADTLQQRPPSSLSRRGFLTLLGAAAATQAIPFNRVWSFPSKIVVPTSGNLFLNTEWITAEALSRLKGNLEIGDVFTLDSVNLFNQEFAVGDTLLVKPPQQYRVRKIVETSGVIGQCVGFDWEDEVYLCQTTV